MRKSYCIICGEEKKGIEVENDLVLDSLRWFKKNVTHDEKNNILVVCRDDYPKYKENRAKFEFRKKFYLGLGFVFVLLMVLLSRAITALLSGIGLMLLFYALSLLSYTPRLKIKAAKPDS